MYAPSIFSARAHTREVLTRGVLRHSREKGFRSVSVLALLTAMVATSGCNRDSKENAAPPAATAKLPAPLPRVPAPPDVATPPADAERTPSGLTMKVLEPGKGTTHP